MRWTRLMLLGAAVLVSGLGLWASLRSGSAARNVSAIGAGPNAAVPGLSGEAGSEPPVGSSLVQKGLERAVPVEAVSLVTAATGDVFGSTGFVASVPEGSEESGGGAAGSAESNDSEGVLVFGRKMEIPGCANEFMSPGEVLALGAEGFAANAAVSFAGKAVGLTGTSLVDPVVAAATADSDGVIAVEWSVPDAPAASVDAVPRAYAMRASGSNAAGGTHTAYVLAPVVAYPGTRPCAKADTATVTLGSTVTVDVLANDTAPAGGSLDAMSVELLRPLGGTFAADAVTGAVTFTPELAFRGTARVSYVVYDGWGLGVEADLTVTVSAGCTVTGVEGNDVIKGTDGDDVLCVPDPDDWRAFWIMDGKGGDDVIYGGDGEEWIYGGEGNGSNDFIVAGAGVDLRGSGRDDATTPSSSRRAHAGGGARGERRPSAAHRAARLTTRLSDRGYGSRQRP